MRHQAFALSHGEALLDRTLNPHQTHTELVFRHFADTADTTVAQVVDIIDFTEAVTDVDQLLDHIQDVTLVQHTGAGIGFTAQATVELHATDA